MNILALDTATKTGWAVHRSVRRPLRYDSGVWDFSIRTAATKAAPADHPGLRFATFAGTIRGALIDWDIDVIFYEMIVGGIHAGGAASLVEKGLEATLLRTAYVHGISRERIGRGTPCWPLAAGTVKKWALGDGTLTATGKREMIRAARRAFPTQAFVPHVPTKTQPWKWDDNQCDALWLLDLGVALLHRYPGLAAGLRTDPLPPADLTKLASRLAESKWKLRR